MSSVLRKARRFAIAEEVVEYEVVVPHGRLPVLPLTCFDRKEASAPQRMPVEAERCDRLPQFANLTTVNIKPHPHIATYLYGSHVDTRTHRSIQVSSNSRSYSSFPLHPARLATPRLTTSIRHMHTSSLTSSSLRVARLEII